MSKVMTLLTGKKQTKGAIPTSQPSGFYQTLFRKLLAALPAEISKNPKMFPQVKMIQLAVSNLTEENAKMLAGHIKSLAQAIEHYEQQASDNQNDNPETN